MRLLAALLVLLHRPARADGLQAAADGVAPARLEVRVDGSVTFEGRPLAAPLVEDLRTWRSAQPAARLVLTADPSSAFGQVRPAIQAAEAAGLPEVTLLTAGAEPVAIPLDVPPAPLALTPAVLTLGLTRQEALLARLPGDTVVLPAHEGAPDLEALAAFLAEDHRLHPASHSVRVALLDVVAFGDAVALFDLVRAHGYSDARLVADLPSRNLSQPPAPLPVAQVTRGVSLHPNGDVEVLAGKRPQMLRHADILGYGAWCLAETCDLVVYAGVDAWRIGEGPRSLADGGWLFSRPVREVDGRLGGAPIRVEGVLSPLVQVEVPEADTPQVVAIDKAAIDAVIRRRRGRFHRCYNRLLWSDYRAAGKVTIKFVIAKDGTVDSATIKNTEIADPTFQRCLTDRFLELQFPEPRGGGIVIVSYPFLFAPS